MGILLNFGQTLNSSLQETLIQRALEENCQELQRKLSPQNPGGYSLDEVPEDIGRAYSRGSLARNSLEDTHHSS